MRVVPFSDWRWKCWWAVRNSIISVERTHIFIKLSEKYLLLKKSCSSWSAAVGNFAKTFPIFKKNFRKEHSKSDSWDFLWEIDCWKATSEREMHVFYYEINSLNIPHISTSNDLLHRERERTQQAIFHFPADFLTLFFLPSPDIRTLTHTHILTHTFTHTHTHKRAGMKTMPRHVFCAKGFQHIDLEAARTWNAKFFNLRSDRATTTSYKHICIRYFKRFLCVDCKSIDLQIHRKQRGSCFTFFENLQIFLEINKAFRNSSLVYDINIKFANGSLGPLLFPAKGHDLDIAICSSNFSCSLFQNVSDWETASDDRDICLFYNTVSCLVWICKIINSKKQSDN